jgi:oxygen-independent coproporphyrinogen-3 oxidase
MRQTAENEALGVYVSVPFCRAKCSFCNFASGVGTDEAVGRYVEQLVLEIAGAREAVHALGAMLPERVDTVYFGGGTPSLLTAGQMRAIFAALRGTFVLEAGAESTLEAAPEQIADELLEAALREGVNRVSLGVQSFVDREAAAVGRSHTGDSCLAEFARLQRAGVRDVGADLIAGLPHQTHASWERSLDAVATSALTHVSVYMFEIDEDSRLGAEVLRGGARFGAPDVATEEQAAELYERACERLPQTGFAQYEISNFAREGFPSRHNRKYWQRAPYVGFGLDAHSMLRREDGGEVRFANTDELGSYGFGARTVPQVVDTDGAFEESLFLGLRMADGIALTDMRTNFGDARTDAVLPVMRELEQAGLMALRGERWVLTGHGRLVSNEVFGRLLEKSAVA